MPVHSRTELEFQNVGFWGEGNTVVPGGKSLGVEKITTTNSTHIWRRVREPKPGQFWWEASALTTASCLLSNIPLNCKENWYFKLIFVLITRQCTVLWTFEHFFIQLNHYADVSYLGSGTLYYNKIEHRNNNYEIQN